MVVGIIVHESGGNPYSAAVIDEGVRHALARAGPVRPGLQAMVLAFYWHSVCECQRLLALFAGVLEEACTSAGSSPP